MKRTRAALFTAMLLPLTGCVFAVGADDEGTEKIRDQVRELEKRVDRLERPQTVVISGEKGVQVHIVDGTVGQEMKVEPTPAPAPAPAKDPK
jgi:hypothetical protein